MRIEEATQLLDLIADAAIITDVGNRVVVWNGGAEVLYGFTAAEALGRPLAELIVPPEARSVELGLSATARKQGSATGRLPRRRRDHAPLEVTVLRKSLRGEGAEADCVLSVERSVQAESALDHRRRLRQRDALLRLARSEVLSQSDHVGALRLITRTAAETLGVARVSVWCYEADQEAIKCLSLHDAAHPDSPAGAVLADRDYPSYFRALRSADVIAAHDAHQDERTREFSRGYLDVLGIASMLDAPIRFGGEMHGVLCHEQVGSPRRWQADEEAFALAVASLVALVLERWERQQVQERLQQRELSLANAQRLARLGDWSIELCEIEWEQNPVRWSEEVYRIFGHEPGSFEVSVANFFRAVPLEEHAVIRQRMKQAMETGERFSFEHRIRRADGATRWLLQRGDCVRDFASGRVVRFIGTVQDISERKEAEAAIQRMAADFRLLFSESPLPMWVYDRETLRFLAVNAAAVQHYGYSSEEFRAMTIADIRPPEDVAALRAVLQPETNSLYSAGVWRHRRRDGSIIFVEITARPLEFQGRPAELILAHDVTSSQEAQRALRESEERFRQLAEAIQDVFWLTDAEKQTMLYISPSHVKMWGTSVESIYANPRGWLDAVHEEDRDRIRAAVRKQADGTYDEEYRIVRPDGTVHWIQEKAFPVHDADGRVIRIAGLASDITERKALERQFFHAQRLESIGTLAAGVAHDLNNILAPMLMAAGLLKRLELPAAGGSLVEMIEKSAQRGAGIVSQLLTFSRGTAGERVPVQARHLLREITELLSETLPRNIAVRLAVPGDLWLVLADATQLHQVLMNLCVNARDAMPQGGELTLSAANVVLPQAGLKGVPAEAKGPFVRLSVVDTGTGIPPAILDRIFDPFFTTKAPGKGTGLGLSTVAGIVRSHSGFMLVDSVAGQGSDFAVYLPASVAEREVPVPPIGGAAANRGHGELILAVDDEAPIRETIRRFLEIAGYSVILAADGQEALREFIAHANAIKLVLTDYMMPGMNGKELGAAIQNLRPNMRIVLLTGLGTTDEPEKPLRLAHTVNKPFTGDELLRTVRATLDAPDA